MSLVLIRVVRHGTDPRQTTDPSHCGTPSFRRWESSYSVYTHEDLAGVVSEGLVLYIKGGKKFVKKFVHYPHHTPKIVDSIWV